jgi:hypothetical protein
MARPRLPITETVRGEILSELKRYATMRKGIPNAHSFWRNVFAPAGYTMKWSTFRDHWRELIVDGLISIDRRTGAVIIHDLDIVERDI